MKDPKDSKTPDLFPVEGRKRGRPPTGKAMTAAERMRRSRERRKAEGKPAVQPPPLSPADVGELEGLREYNATLQGIVTSQGRQLGEYLEKFRALHEQITRLMRTEAQLRRSIEDKDTRIRDLEAKEAARRKPRS